MADKFTDKHKKAVGIISLLILILLSIAIFLFIGKPLLSFASQPQLFREWINSFGILGRLIFIGIIILQVVVAIIPGEPFEIAAGYAFGALEGTLLCIVGIILGSFIIFLLVKKFGVKLVEAFFPPEKINSLKFLQNKTRRNTIYFIVMCIPGTPKDLLSYFAPLTDINLSTWLIIVAISRIPSIITSTIGGDALGDKQYLFAIIAFVVTMTISGLGLLIYRKIQDKHNDKK